MGDEDMVNTGFSATGVSSARHTIEALLAQFHMLNFFGEGLFQAASRKATHSWTHVGTPCDT